MENGYKYSNKGSQIVSAPKAPKKTSNGGTVVRGEDLRTGKSGK